MVRVPEHAARCDDQSPAFERRDQREIRGVHSPAEKARTRAQYQRRGYALLVRYLVRGEPEAHGEPRRAGSESVPRQSAISDVRDPQQCAIVTGELDLGTENLSANAHSDMILLAKRVGGARERGHMLRDHGRPYLPQPDRWNRGGTGRNIPRTLRTTG